MGAFISLIITEIALVISGFLSILTATKGSGDARKYAIFNIVLVVVAAIVAFIIAVLLF